MTRLFVAEDNLSGPTVPRLVQFVVSARVRAARARIRIVLGKQMLVSSHHVERRKRQRLELTRGFML
jgi:hypothetical protein